MKSIKQSSVNHNSEIRTFPEQQTVLSEHDLLLIRETAKLTENLYVKMICDNLAMEKILRLM